MKPQGAYKSRMFANIIAVTLLAALALAVGSSAQEQKEQKKKHHHYKFVDLGTFGGPTSGVNGEPSVQVINNAGTVVGVADTSILTPAPG